MIVNHCESVAASALAGRPHASGSLATVIENLPLSYDMDTKSLSRTASLANQGDESPSTRPFKRGHIRRSSYESAQIQLNFSRKDRSGAGAVGGGGGGVNRAASLGRCEMPNGLLSSMSLHADSASCASVSTGLTPDSALGDSACSSKRDSLDRKSDVSSADWELVDDAEEGPSSSAEPKKTSKLGFAKGFFSRKKNSSSTSSAPWRLFGEKKAHGSDVIHTTGLILEERPSNLPAKSEEEAARHRQLYQEMIEQAKKKELKLEKDRKRAKAEQKRLEEQAAAASKLWSEQILPKWEEMKNSKRCMELWWQGVPSKVRGRVWALSIGNDLNLTHELYSICCARAALRFSEDPKCVEEEEEKESPMSQEASLRLIHLDITRTFPQLGIFQNGGPYYDLLLNLLGAYVCYRPDVGYVQSMSFLAAVLLLQMDPFPAFVAFANLLNRPLQVAFFRLRQPAMTEYFIAFDRYFEQELPRLHAHFDRLDVRPDLYLIEWVYTLFAKSLPLDVTCRVWDVFLRDGEEFVFKTGLGILRQFEQQLLEMEFDEAVSFLTHLPPLVGAELFRHIEPFMRPYGNSESARTRKRFLQILGEVHEKLTPCGAGGELPPQAQQLQLICSQVQGMKMSKSLSSFIGDLLAPPP